MTGKTVCDRWGEHDFDKFDDATIYCRRCGEQRVMDVQALIAKLPQPIYLPCPCPGPHWQPYPWIVTTGTWTPEQPVTITYGTVPNDTTNTVGWPT